MTPEKHEEMDKTGCRRWNDLSNKGRNGIGGIALVKTAHVQTEKKKNHVGFRWKSWQGWRGGTKRRVGVTDRQTDGESRPSGAAKIQREVPFVLFTHHKKEHLKWHTNLSQWQIKVYHWYYPKARYVSSLRFTFFSCRSPTGTRLEIKHQSSKVCFGCSNAPHYLSTQKNSVITALCENTGTHTTLPTHTHTHTQLCPYTVMGYVPG